MSSSADDLAVLHPEIDLDIGGETVTVREFSFIQGVKLSALVAPIVSDLSAVLASEDEDIDLGVLGELMGNHTETMIKLMAQSVRRKPEWVAALPDGDGQRLFMAFWEVNSDFFMRRLVMTLVSHQPQPSPSAPSTPH